MSSSPVLFPVVTKWFVTLVDEEAPLTALQCLSELRCDLKSALSSYETEINVPGLQTKYSASHSLLPFLKDGCFACISSVNLPFRLAILNRKRIKRLNFWC